MATGDSSDILARLKALLPNGWFKGTTTVLDALLSGFATALALAYSLIAYARLQTRIATATDGFLDLIALDYFGTSIARNGQLDTPFRSRILSELLRPRATRAAVIRALTDLTGRAPLVFEPERPLDTGAYGAPISGYGLAGGYGSLKLPAQFFVQAYRPSGSGIPLIAGYGISTGAYSTPSVAEYADISMVTGAVTDANIYAAVDAVKAAGTTAWTRISN